MKLDFLSDGAARRTHSEREDGTPSEDFGREEPSGAAERVIRGKPVRSGVEVLAARVTNARKRIRRT